MKSFPCAQCKNECLSELLGTYLLVLIGPGTVIAVSLFLSLASVISLSIISLSFGATVAGVILLLGRYSAHINPAITLAHVLSRSTRQRLFIPFITLQTVGDCLPD